MDGIEEITRENERGVTEFRKVVCNGRDWRRWISSNFRHKGWRRKKKKEASPGSEKKKPSNEICFNKVFLLFNLLC